MHNEQELRIFAVYRYTLKLLHSCTCAWGGKPGDWAHI